MASFKLLSLASLVGAANNYSYSSDLNVTGAFDPHADPLQAHGMDMRDYERVNRYQANGNQGNQYPAAAPVPGLASSLDPAFLHDVLERNPNHGGYGAGGVGPSGGLNLSGADPNRGGGSVPVGHGMPTTLGGMEFNPRPDFINGAVQRRINNRRRIPNNHRGAQHALQPGAGVITYGWRNDPNFAHAPAPDFGQGPDYFGQAQQGLHGQAQQGPQPGALVITYGLGNDPNYAHAPAPDFGHL